MNEKAQSYWNTYWAGKTPPQSVIAEQFGFEEHADELAQLIIAGRKTATCSAHVLYEIENDPLPAVGLYTVILNSRNEPVAMIKTVAVQVLPMNEISVEHAMAEGEGDLSYQYWWDCHQKVFSIELAEHGLEFSEDMLLVCERFELVDVVQSGGVPK
ncbi:MAG: ASCH domain-containing protein [Oscillospiraceae bacterium]|nr:ASCH domain-containing protein [Oscillospiraceae bacterium]